MNWTGTPQNGKQEQRTMVTELVPSITPEAVMERVITTGDLSKMTPAERVTYYMETCKSIGWNPLTRPMEYITLQGKLTLYVTRGGTDQLRQLRGISLEVTQSEVVGDAYVVGIKARDATGREDWDLGVVPLPAGGADRANAIMKAITKAKRRATLSICGLGWLDESELETIRGAAPVVVDMATGEIGPGAGVTIRDILALREAAGIDDAKMAGVVAGLFGGRKLRDLTGEERETLAEHLRAAADEQS